jgi:hypothetical protein
LSGFTLVPAAKRIITLKLTRLNRTALSRCL